MRRPVKEEEIGMFSVALEGKDMILISEGTDASI